MREARANKAGMHCRRRKRSGYVVWASPMPGWVRDVWMSLRIPVLKQAKGSFRMASQTEGRCSQPRWPTRGTAWGSRDDLEPSRLLKKLDSASFESCVIAVVE